MRILLSIIIVLFSSKSAFSSWSSAQLSPITDNNLEISFTVLEATQDEPEVIYEAFSSSMLPMDKHSQVLFSTRDIELSNQGELEVGMFGNSNKLSVKFTKTFVGCLHDSQPISLITQPDSNNVIELGFITREGQSIVEINRTPVCTFDYTFGETRMVAKIILKNGNTGNSSTAFNMIQYEIY